MTNKKQKNECKHINLLIRLSKSGEKITNEGYKYWINARCEGCGKKLNERGSIYVMRKEEGFANIQEEINSAIGIVKGDRETLYNKLNEIADQVLSSNKSQDIDHSKMNFD